MTKKIWDIYAPIYKLAMKADEKIYNVMYTRIPEVIAEKEVLEIATGPGLLAKHVAFAAKKMIATDYSEGMIQQAKKGNIPKNLTFEVADATNLSYEDHSFDVVLIANALHIMPQPEKAMQEIDRVLREGGTLIAPNFVEHKGGFISTLWSNILRIAGVKFEHQWSAEEYENFLKANGWTITRSKKMQARIAIDYVECVRSRER